MSTSHYQTANSELGQHACGHKVDCGWSLAAVDYAKNWMKKWCFIIHSSDEDFRCTSKRRYISPDNSLTAKLLSSFSFLQHQSRWTPPPSTSRNHPSQSCSWGPKGRHARPTAESGVGFGEFHQLEGLGSNVSSLSGIRGRAPTANAFWSIQSPEMHQEATDIVRSGVGGFFPALPIWMQVASSSQCRRPCTARCCARLRRGKSSLRLSVCLSVTLVYPDHIVLISLTIIIRKLAYIGSSLMDGNERSPDLLHIVKSTRHMPVLLG